MNRNGKSMDVKRHSRNIGKMMAIAMLAKKNNVAFEPLDDPNATLSRLIKSINHRNMFMDQDVNNVEVLFPSAYKIKPLNVLLTEQQIKDINKIDERILIEKKGD